MNPTLKGILSEIAERLSQEAPESLRRKAAKLAAKDANDTGFDDWLARRLNDAADLIEKALGDGE